MKKLLFRSAAILALLPSLLVAQTPPAAAPPHISSISSPDAPDIQAVKQRMADISAAWSTLDPDKAAPYYDKGADDVFFDIAPLKYNGWAEYAAGAKKMLTTFKSLKLTNNPDAKIWVNGDHALAISTVHADAVMTDAKTMSSDARWTLVFVRHDGNWLVVHEHVSFPAP
jgi:uncharacterized protein (TIGR02246 family)